MSWNRFARKVDTSQPEIVKGLEAAGVKVFAIGWPCDLLCYYYSNRHHAFIWATLECKTAYGVRAPKARSDKRQREQQEFLASTQTPTALNLGDALRQLGIYS